LQHFDGKCYGTCHRSRYYIRRFELTIKLLVMDVFEENEFKKQISTIYEASLKSEKVKNAIELLYEAVIIHAQQENIKLSTFE